MVGSPLGEVNASHFQFCFFLCAEKPGPATQVPGISPSETSSVLVLGQYWQAGGIGLKDLLKDVI